MGQRLCFEDEDKVSTEEIESLESVGDPWRPRWLAQAERQALLYAGPTAAGDYPRRGTVGGPAVSLGPLQLPLESSKTGS